MFSNNIILLLHHSDSNEIQAPIYGIVANLTEFKLINTELLHEYTHGKSIRDEHNYALFQKSLLYLGIYVMCGCIIYILTYAYKIHNNTGRCIIINYGNKYDTDEPYINTGKIVYINEQNRHVELLYDDDVLRKNSIDISTDDDDMSSIGHYVSNSRINNAKKIFYYITFGVNILIFEYVFFQYIVLYYNPLSLGELRYIIIQFLLDE
jgi:hypothetical protein